MRLIEKLFGWKELNQEEVSKEIKDIILKKTMRINEKNYHKDFKKHRISSGYTFYIYGKTFKYKIKVPAIDWFQNHGHGDFVWSPFYGKREKIYRKLKNNSLKPKDKL
jgi:hypothetical protein